MITQIQKFSATCLNNTSWKLFVSWSSSSYQQKSTKNKGFIWANWHEPIINVSTHENLSRQIVDVKQK